jgi:integrase
MVANVINFTEARIGELEAPPGKRLEYQDAKTPGLKLRVGSPNADGAVARSFSYYGRINGKPQRITIGPWPRVSCDIARKKARALAGQVAMGVDPVAEKKRDRITGATLGEIFEEYLAVRKLKPRSVLAYRECFKLFEKWRDRPLNQISRDDVVKLHAERSKVTEAGANLAFKVLSALYVYAQDGAMDDDDRPLIDNPVARLKTRKLWNKIKPRKNIIPLPRTGEFYDVVTELRPNTMADFTLFLLLTAMRRTHAASLRWSAIDLELGTVTLLAKDTKNDEDAILPLATQVVDMLRQRWGSGKGRKDYVFKTRGNGTGPVTNPSRVFQKATKATGITVSAHDLRRTFASMAGSLLIPDTIIKRMLTHTTSNVTQNYIVLSPEEIRPSVQKVADALIGHRNNVIPFQKVAA